MPSVTPAGNCTVVPVSPEILGPRRHGGTEARQAGGDTLLKVRDRPRPLAAEGQLRDRPAGAEESLAGLARSPGLLQDFAALDQPGRLAR